MNTRSPSTYEKWPSVWPGVSGRHGCRRPTASGVSFFHAESTHGRRSSIRGDPAASASHQLQCRGDVVGMDGACPGHTQPQARFLQHLHVAVHGVLITGSTSTAWPVSSQPREIGVGLETGSSCVKIMSGSRRWLHCHLAGSTAGRSTALPAPRRCPCRPAWPPRTAAPPAHADAPSGRGPGQARQANPLRTWCFSTTLVDRGHADQPPPIRAAPGVKAFHLDVRCR